MTREPILIAGGGIGGAAAALALARQGWPVRVLEQLREFGEIGAGIQLGPNVYKMLETLGLTDAIDATAVRPDALVMRDALDGEIVTRVPLNNAGFAKFFSLSLRCHVPSRSAQRTYRCLQCRTRNRARGRRKGNWLHG